MGEKHIAVIGSGLAGAAAAAQARKHAARVTVIAGPPGATAFSSGALDIAGDPCPPAERPDAYSRDAHENLVRLMIERPRHPYSLLGQGADDPAETVLGIIRIITSELFPEGSELMLEGDLERLTPCFTSLGTTKFTSLYFSGIANPEAPGMEKPLALEIDACPDFDPLMWAKVAAENAARIGLRLQPITGSIASLAGRELGSPELASHIASDPAAFIAAVKQSAAGKGEFTSVVLPPVLPASDRREILYELQVGLSVPVYEVLSLPPSVPGLRLWEHLQARLSDLGAEIIRGRVTGFTTSGGAIKSIEVNSPDGKQNIEADAVVLASGKFMSGGIEKKKAFRETVFGLPVLARPGIPADCFIEKVLSLHVSGCHTLFEAGLQVDDQLRPLNGGASTAFSNLHAAGAAISGHNYISDGTGSGVALATGARAGMYAAG